MTAPRTLLLAFLPACLGLAFHASPALAQAPAPGTLSTSADPAAAPLPPPAPIQPDLPAPGTRWELLGTGIAISAVSYGLALGASYAWPDDRMANELRVPLVGPWMAIADTGCSKDEPDCSTVLLVFTAILSGMDGVLQAGGLAVALESAFLPTSNVKPRAKAAATVHPVPYVAGRDGLGLGLAGTF